MLTAIGPGTEVGAHLVVSEEEEIGAVAAGYLYRRRTAERARMPKAQECCGKKTNDITTPYVVYINRW
jgi:hypothetical protein